MKMYLTALAITAGIGLVAVFTGRALLGLVGPRWARGRAPEHFALAALLGTGALALGFGWLSHLGVSGRTAALALGAAGVVLMPVAWVRSRGRLLGPTAPLLPGLGLCGVILGGAALTLLPLRYGGFGPFNDAFTYMMLAEWLQTHGFGEPCPLDPDHPAATVVHQYQEWHLRMGSTFLLALVRAALPHYMTFELFLPVSAWGVVLNQSAIFLVCRWVLGLPRAFGLAAGLFAVAFVNPYFFAIHNGFQPQLFGTAFTALLVALLGRTVVRARWTVRDAGVLAFAGAGLLSVYSEMVPVAGLTAAAFTAGAGWRAVRRGGAGRLGVFVLTGVGLALVLGNVEWLRLSKALPFQLKAVIPIKIEWPREAFATFALGIGPIPGDGKPAWWQGVAAGLAAVCFGVGLLRCAADRRARVLLAAVGVFALMAVYFGGVARDPLTGRTGHGWSLLKVCQWAAPLVAVVEAAGLWLLLRSVPAKAQAHPRVTSRNWGLWLLLRSVPAKGLVALAVPLGVLALTLPDHREAARGSATSVAQAAGDEHPFQALRRLRRQVDATGAENVHLLTHPDEAVFPRSFYAYLLYPRPFTNGWKGSWLEPSSPADRLDRTGPRTLVLSTAPPPFEPPAERLGEYMYRLSTPDRPVIVQMHNPNFWIDRPGGGEPLTWLGSAPVRFTVWSPRAGKAELTFTGLSGPSRPEDLRRRLVARQSTGAVREFDLGVMRLTPASLTFDLPAGVSTIELQCPDAPTTELRWPSGHPYQLLVAIQAPRLTLTGVPSEAPAAAGQPAAPR